MSVNAGSSVALKATVSGADRTVIWSSDDISVASVSEEGVVTGIKEGTATIIATANGIEAKCIVTVNPVINASNIK